MASVAAPTESDVLSIRLDRTQPDAIEAPGTFTVSDDFTIEVTNEGEPIHVHLTCDDDIAPAVDFETGNHFVPRKGTYQVPVTVLADDRPKRGRVRVSVGYGSETAYVELRVVEPASDDEVRVDESLAEPPSRADPDSNDGTRAMNPIMFATIGVAIAAVVGAVVVVGLYTDLVIGVVLAVGVVAVAAAAYALQQTE